jgi:hypothetical protein
MPQKIRHEAAAGKVLSAVGAFSPGSGAPETKSSAGSDTLT